MLKGDPQLEGIEGDFSAMEDMVMGDAGSMGAANEAFANASAALLASSHHMHAPPASNKSLLDAAAAADSKPKAEVPVRVASMSGAGGGGASSSASANPNNLTVCNCKKSKCLKL